MSTCLVFPVAGKGSRFNGTAPKSLSALSGKPVLERLLRGLIDPSITEVILVANSGNIEYFLNFAQFSEFGEKIEVILDDSFNGSSAAVSAALTKTSCENVVVVWGDHVGASLLPLQRLLNTLHETDRILIPVVWSERPYACVRFFLDSEGNGNRTKFEKPGLGPGFADCGTIISRKWMLEHALRSVQLTTDLDLMRLLIERTSHVTFPRMTDFRLSIGINTYEDLLEAEVYFGGGLDD